jgi:hypothetical protein
VHVVSFCSGALISLFLLLNTMIRSSPTCFREKKVFELPCIATWPLLHHIFNISAEANCSQSLDAPLWVALAIVQSYNPRRKVPRSEISIPDLEICLSKAVFAAAQHSGTTPC